MVEISRERTPSAIRHQLLKEKVKVLHREHNTAAFSHYWHIQTGRQTHGTQGDELPSDNTDLETQEPSEETHRPTRRMSHESKSDKNHTSAMRPGVLESRLIGQEQTLAVLLEQAFRIKEEVAAGLQSTAGSLQAEALSRRLLESHILTVTRIVKQLSLDIQTLERRMAQRDSITAGTTMAVQSLDQKGVATTGDLRGRLVRCDAAITKLSADVSAGDQQLIRTQQEVAEVRSAVDLRFKALEAQLQRDVRRVEASLSERSQGQRSAMSDLHSHVTQLDARMSGELKEAKALTDSLRNRTEQELSSSAQHCAAQEDKLSKALSGFADRLEALEARVAQTETRAGGCQADDLRRSEARLSQRMSSVEESLHQKLQLLKQDYHKGFLSVRDTIEALRQIGEIKSHLDRKQLRKDVRDV